ncbi:MAG TPA: ABC transporter substrate-binding protein [Acidimicrobiales bacterium]|nr:ABC transporter substrate-binding protein [Acidimicrobiales bacterium]
MRHRVLTLVAGMALLSTVACGARLNSQQYVEARGAGTGGGGGGAAAAAGTTKTGATGTGTGTGAAAPGAAQAGGATPAAGGGAGGSAPGGAAAGAACTPQHTDAPGVTDSEIKLGNISTISGPVPNFGATGRAGAKAYLDYVNSQGGVCGRKLSLVNGDDRLDPGINRSQTDQMKDSVFGFVGNTTVEDDGGADVIGGTNIANCSLIIGSEALKQSNFYSPNPIDPSGTTNGTVGIWSWMKANKGITKVGIVYPDNPNAAARIQGYQTDIAQAGLTADPIIKVSVTESNYVGVATQMKNAGDDAFITVLEVNGISKLAQAIKQVGWQPKAPFYGAQAYGPQLPQLAGDAANGAIIGLTHDIVEGAGPAMQTMSQYYQASSSGQPLDFFAIMGWAAAKMCVDAIAAAGPAPTRDAVIAALNGLHNFTADDLLAPRDPAGKKSPTKFVMVTIDGGVWKRVYPAQGFADQ